MKILDLLAGYKTYILGIAMVIHAVSQAIISLSSGAPINQVDMVELMGGLGLISARRASQMGR